MDQEYGGCLSLEKTGTGKNPYDSFNKIQLNCGRAGIYAACLDGKADTLLVPYYMCPTVEDYLQKRLIKIKKYNLDQSYRPMVDSLKANEMILWPDYYGCMFPEVINGIVETFGSRLIVDCTQALFLKPAEHAEAYYVYSIRKFIGVPEGCYLIKNGINSEHLSFRQGEGRYDWNYLELCLKQGPNAAYRGLDTGGGYLENEERMKLPEAYMEKKTENYLKQINWDHIQQTRMRNFQILHKHLQSINRADVDYSSETPYMYPLLIDQKDLRARLIEHKIYVSTWWKDVLQQSGSAEHEKEWTEYLIPLPIDQRYSEIDMESIAQVVLSEGARIYGKEIVSH